MTGGMDSSRLSQVIQNPAMLQMMQNILSDPQAMNRVGAVIVYVETIILGFLFCELMIFASLLA